MSDQSSPPCPDRRALLAGVLACALPPLPVLAQDKTPQDKPGPRRFSLKAERIRAVLDPANSGEAAKVESALYRLSLKDNQTSSSTASAAASSTASAAASSTAPANAAPFPILRVRAGEAFEIEVENTLTQPLGLHLRGLRGPNAADGVPGLTQAPVPPGGKHSITLPGTQAGTFILQPVLPELAAEQNARGLFGVVIIEEANADPALFDHDLVLAFSDWRLDDKGALVEDFLSLPDTARLGRLGNRLAINGAPAPTAMEVRPGARIRVRMVNVANARVVPLKVSGYPAEVFAIDSTPCQPFDPLKRTVIMAPATRLEMVLQAPQEAGASGAIEAKLGNGLPLYTFRTAGTPVAPRGKLAALPDPGLPPAIRLQDATRAELVIEGGIGTRPEEAEPDTLKKRFPVATQVFTLSMPNGGAEKPGGFARRPLARLKKGGVFVLALNNRTAWPQVIGVHGHAFRLLHPYDDGWEPYFLDTLYLAPGTKAQIALIADNPGKWAIRSTIAEHYGTGVATWFEVS